MSKRDVHNGQDVIDSRDVIARIEELEAQRDDDSAPCACGLSLVEHTDPAVDHKPNPLDEDEREELRVLLALQDEASGSPDWPHGETLIRDSYFESYAQELAEDIGAYKDSSQWPGNCIDWGQAAEQLQQDYTSVEFDGVTYWIRS